ncbi:MAG: serine/threonine-protein kinase [Planctomycetota bacterium]
MSLSDPVTRGVALALTAEREGLLDEHGLTAVLTYYERQGRRGQLTPEQVLCDLGGLDPATLTQLFQASPVSLTLGPRPFAERLQLLGSLGEGGMGTVYRAYDRVLRRVVALKLIRADRLGATARRALQRFEREAQVMARVRHPNCVAIYSAGELRGQPFLLMQYVRGETLEARIEREGPLDPHQVAAWGRDLAMALESCHGVGVVHRDVKPANVLLDEHDSPRLTDFGIAMDVDARTKLTREHGAVGTLAYMPPEQAMGKPADARADVYSLGATLFEALTGQLVFPTEQPLLLLHQITAERPRAAIQVRREVPMDLSRVVGKCLEKDPADRYATAAEVGRDLTAFLSNEPVSARPLSLVQVTLRRIRRRRKLILSASAAMVVVALLLGLVGYQRDAARRATQRDELARATGLENLQDSIAALTTLSLKADGEIALEAREAILNKRFELQLQRAHAVIETLDVVWEELLTSQRDLLKLEATGIWELPLNSPARLAFRKVKKEYVATSVRLQATLRAAYEALAGASALQPGRSEVATLTAQVLCKEAEATEDLDQRAAVLDRAASVLLEAACPLPDRLAPPSVRCEAAEGASIEISQLVVGSAGKWELRDAQTVEPNVVHPLRVGRYVVTVTTPTEDSFRVPIRVERGPCQILSLALLESFARAWLREAFVFVPTGVVHNLPFSERSTPVPLPAMSMNEFLVSPTEATVEEWYSFRCDQGWPDSGVLATGHGDEWPSTPPALPLRRLPATGVTRHNVERYLAWLNHEGARARFSVGFTLPVLQQFLRALRGPFCWRFPWGPEYDQSLRAMGPGLSCVGSVQGDQSVFEVWDLATSVFEMAAEQVSQPGYKPHVGGHSVSNWLTLAVALDGYSFSEERRQSMWLGFRVYAVGAPLPDLHQDPELCAAKKAEALQLVQLTDYLGTIRVAGEAIDADPLDIQAWQIRAEARRALEDFWGVNFDAHRMVELDPTYVHGWTLMGIAQEQRGKLDRALEAWNKALELAPQATDGYRMRARVKGKLGDVAGALEDLRTFEANAPADFPTRPDAAALRAELEAKRGE